MEVRAFIKGLNKQVSKYLLASQEAQIFENIDNSSGILKSFNKPKLIGELPKYFYKWHDNFIGFDEKTWFVEFNNNFIYSRNGSCYKKTFLDEDIPLGIEAPENAPKIKKVEASPDVLDDVNITSETDLNSDLPVGEELIYWVINIKGELYSPPYEMKVKVLDENTAIRFNSFTGMEDKVIIYRKYNGVFKKLIELNPSETFTDNSYDISRNENFEFKTLPNGTYRYCYTFYSSRYGLESVPSPISEEVEVENGGITLFGFDFPHYDYIDKIRIYRIGGNLTTFTLVDTIDLIDEYTDLKADIDTERHILDSYDNDTPPETLKYLTVYNAILFGVENNYLWFSKIGEPDYFPSYNFIKFEEDITGLAKTSNGLLVFLKNKTYIIVGTNPSDFAKFLLSDRIGCVSHDTIASMDNAVFWLSDDGVVLSDGGRLEIITRPKLGLDIFKNLNPIKAVVWDGTYWLLCEGLILFIRFKLNNTIGIITNDNPEIQWIETFDNDFYGWANGSLFEMFKGDSLYKLHYKSPAFTENSLTLHKLYNSVYIAYKGNFVVKLYIDDKLIQTINISSENLKVDELLIPQEYQRGYSLEIEIEGEGEVYEFEYKIFPRQVD